MHIYPSTVRRLDRSLAGYPRQPWWSRLWKAQACMRDHLRDRLLQELRDPVLYLLRAAVLQDLRDQVRTAMQHRVREAVQPHHCLCSG